MHVYSAKSLQNDQVKKASGPGGGTFILKGDEKVELQG